MTILNATFEAGQRAVLEATYSDFKLIKTRKVISLCFEVPIEQADLVHQVLGMPNPAEEKWVAIARLGMKQKQSTTSENKEKQSVTKGEYGDYAQKLYKSGFFLHEEVWRALGSDDQFLAWIRTQPSCIDGDDYNVVACHVRRVANGAGTAIKPPYSAVPMTQAQHQVQTSPGEMDCLNQWKVGGRSEWTAATAKTWFDRQRLHYVQLWAKTRLKEALKAESLADIAPERIRQWCEDNMVSTNFLPEPPCK